MTASENSAAWTTVDCQSTSSLLSRAPQALGPVPRVGRVRADKARRAAAHRERERRVAQCVAGPLPEATSDRGRRGGMTAGARTLTYIHISPKQSVADTCTYTHTPTHARTHAHTELNTCASKTFSFLLLYSIYFCNASIA